MQTSLKPKDPDPRVAEIEAELLAFAERSGEAVSTICRKALGYSSWLEVLRRKRERDAEMIRLLREYMEAHDAGERTTGDRPGPVQDEQTSKQHDITTAHTPATGG